MEKQQLLAEQMDLPMTSLFMDGRQDVSDVMWIKTSQDE
jgi:hypothetical protein